MQRRNKHSKFTDSERNVCFFQMYTGKKEEFFLYCVIMEASVIDKIYGAKPVYFELSIGEFEERNRKRLVTIQNGEI